MSEQNIRVTARPRASGIDIDRLALALLELAEQPPEPQHKRVRVSGKKLIAVERPHPPGRKAEPA